MYFFSKTCSMIMNLTCFYSSSYINMLHTIIDSLSYTVKIIVQSQPKCFLSTHRFSIRPSFSIRSGWPPESFWPPGSRVSNISLLTSSTFLSVLTSLTFLTLLTWVAYIAVETRRSLITWSPLATENRIFGIITYIIMT